MKDKKLSLAELKEKAGKAFLDANAVKGGVLDSCHTPIFDKQQVEPIRTDNL
ncbi:MAG: hypothetical protein LBU84_07310 [Prevotella sp.]|jgi:hypothetical protein|nr:hypothetical protein [Prevotella sp.]